MQTLEAERGSLFYRLFETSLDAILLTMPEGGCCMANRAAEKLLGYSTTEFAALQRKDFVDENDPAIAALLSERARVGTASGDARMRKKDGSWFHAHLSSILFTDQNGQTWASVTVRDLTQQLSMRRELEEVKNRYMSVVDALFEGIVMLDEKGRIYASNESAQRICGLTPEQMLGKTPLDPAWRTIRRDGTPFPPDRLPGLVALNTGKPVRDVELGIHKSNGELTWVRVNSTPLFRNGESRPFAVVSSFEDITRRTRLELELRRQALTDPLTGLSNRRAFREQIQQQFDLSRKTGMPASIVMLDIDEFSAINDFYGRAVGDDLLKGVAESISSLLRATDCCARFGSDEFYILLPAADLPIAIEMAQRLKAGIAASAFELVGVDPISLAVSVGYASLTPQDSNVRSWLQRCDTSLRVAKLAEKTASATSRARK